MAALKNDLLFLWEFDGDANEKIQGAHLSTTGSISYPAGKIKKCAYFSNPTGNATQNYLSRNAAPYIYIPAPSDVCTFSFWVNIITTGSSGICGIAGHSIYPAGQSWGFRADNVYGSGKFRLMVSNGSGTNKYYTTALNLNTWYHFVIHAPSVVFVNGVKETLDGNFSVLWGGTAPICFGVDDYDLNSRRLNGYIEQFAIWNRYLSDDEALMLYNGGSGLDLEM